MLNGAAPVFAISGGIWLALLRGLFDAACFSAFGALLFRTLTVEPLLARQPAGTGIALEARLRLLVRVSLVAALATLAGWLVDEAGLIAGATGLARHLAVLPTVLAATRFGHLAMLQALLLALALVRCRGRTALALSAAVLLLQAGHGHAVAMDGALSLLALSELVHLLAGGAWLGGLLPLLLTVRLLPARSAAGAARSFSIVGKWSVGLMAVTATIQGWSLIGSVPALLGTAYGWVACLKLTIFAALLGFACLNRYRLAPALLGADPALARRRLTVSIAVQTGVGLLVLLAAGVLSNLPPSLHEQPVWPFAWQVSLVTVREDAAFKTEALAAGAALAGAAILAVVGLFLRRWRRPAALLTAAIVAVLAVPHLDLLLVEANPASFYHSPTGFAASAIVEGASLYPGRCAACHGADGHGDGPLAASLPVPPADLTASHLWMHSDGELFWWLAHGIAAPDGRLAMPGFASVLSDDQRWALIDFVRARNAGIARHAAGHWPQPVRAPALQAVCDGGRPVTLADLRGRVVRLAGGAAAPLADPDVVTVQVSGAADAPAHACVASDPSILDAYAIVSGLDRDRAAASWFLIDAEGWLRDVVPRDVSPSALRSAIASLRRGKVAPSASPEHMDMPMHGMSD